MTDDELDGNDVVRRKAAELDLVVRRARTTGLALNVAIGALMVTAAIFSAWNTYRLRDISQDNRRLFEVVQTYNEEHADAAGQSFEAINVNMRCMFDWMASYNEALANSLAGNPRPLPERAALDACFKPTTPQPPAPSPKLIEPKGEKP